MYWSGRNFMIGSGKELRKNTLLSVTVPAEQQYKKGGVSFKTGDGVEGIFSVTDMGRKLFIFMCCLVLRSMLCLPLSILMFIV